MKKFLLFIAGLVALGVLLTNLGPMVLLGVSVWLLYVVFKQFMKSDSTAGKIGWVALGLIILSVAVSNIYAVIGLVAAYALYVIYKKMTTRKDESVVKSNSSDDPFTNFERQWAELNK
ncbi:lmo0954 family membrane protein [Halobacillus amylolyticus]|uniref:Flagellar basal body rod protein n=1 Tax=Halobacillus amylolyticus TaxID=2932259 RepID=A0ABY4H9W8_9BACI|nr:flagellar basal body rod protein [Halobacillus amylolyticus]UOR11088.1 flagellar basal body rod protein [Halobacillus amylolyticus]